MLESKDLNIKSDNQLGLKNYDLTLPNKIPRIGSKHILEKTLIENKKCI